MVPRRDGRHPPLLPRAEHQGDLRAATVTPPNTALVATNAPWPSRRTPWANSTLQATDADSNPLTYSTVAKGSKGTAVVTNASINAYTYTLNAGSTSQLVHLQGNNDGTVDSNIMTVNVTIASREHAVSLNGSNQYVRFGQARTRCLHFTIELWFKRTGAGVGTRKGVVATVYPAADEGRAEVDGSNVDMNYFLGSTPRAVLTADFEDLATGANHFVVGTNAISSNVWHHAAATYDGGKSGASTSTAFDKTQAVGAPTPTWDSIQHAALGTAMNSTGVAAGFFEGAIDEARAESRADPRPHQRREGRRPGSSGAGHDRAVGPDEDAGTTAADSLRERHQRDPDERPHVGGRFVAASGAGRSDGERTGQRCDRDIHVAHTGCVGVRPRPRSTHRDVPGPPCATGVFQTIATNTNVPSGTSTTASWAGLGAGQEFEWFVRSTTVPLSRRGRRGPSRPPAPIRSRWRG